MLSGADPPQNRNSEQKGANVRKWRHFTPLSHICAYFPHFLLEVGLLGPRSSKAYKSNGILGVLGVPLGFKTGKPPSEQPFTEKVGHFTGSPLKSGPEGFFTPQGGFYPNGTPRAPKIPLLL